IDNSADTLITGNRIGVSPDGIPVPNGVGIQLSDTPATVSSNYIAHNDGPAIIASGEAVVLISRNFIYENDAGIVYGTEPFDAPEGVLVMRTDPSDQNKVGVFVAVPPTGATG